MKEQLKKDYLQANNSYVTKHFMAFEIRNEHYFYSLCQNTTANVDKCEEKKNRFEGTRHKSGKIDTIEMSRNTPPPSPVKYQVECIIY